MHTNIGRAAALTALALLGACVESTPSAPTSAGSPPARRYVGGNAFPSVRISEFHYDNLSNDVDEAIEISGPAGTDLTGWRIVRFNGSTPSAAAAYTTPGLATPTPAGAVSAVPFPAGTLIPATCADRGVVVVRYAVDGLQNGTADGFALVNAAGVVIELLSYEGVFTVAANQTTAAGLTSIDVGQSEVGTTPVGFSLQRTAAGTWSAPAAATLGACNDNGPAAPTPVVTTISLAPDPAAVTVGATVALTGTARDAANTPIAGVTFTWSTSNPAIASVSTTGIVTGVAAGTATITATAANGVSASRSVVVTAALPPVATGAVRFTEIHYDNVGTDVGEQIEIEGPAGTDLTNWQVVLYNGNGGASYATQALTGLIPATCGARGVIVVPIAGIQNGGTGTTTETDGFALIDGAGAVVEFLSYEGPVGANTLTASNGPAAGRTSVNIGVAQDGAALGLSLQRNAAGTSWRADASSFGSCATDGTPAQATISITGRNATDAPLPVGFQDQLFATVRDANNVVLVEPITWTTDLPTLATIDARGVLTGVGAGQVTVRATSASATRTLVLPIIDAVASATASYVGHTAFGDPVDATPDDDYILRRTEYTTSWNRNRGIPNWVSYNLEATHFGSQDRCDCFTFDPLLPAEFPRYTTADYTDAGTFAGYGIDRGHLARSFDRTSGSLDNARTFYFTNIIPQAATVNQGPWALFENYLGAFAQSGDREVYVINGATGSKGTLKNEGKITIPTHVWKIAVVLPRNQSLADVNNRNTAQLFAVIMRNDSDVGGGWEQYQTTVDAVEALSGYDLLSLLPDDLERELERGNRFPTAVANGGYSAPEGSAISFSAAGSSDPDASSTLTYSWSFGDGTTATGIAPSKRYAQNGSYTVSLTVTDQLGASHTVLTAATITNAAPTVFVTPPASWTAGTARVLGVRWTDPGVRDAPYTVRINWGDASPITQFSSLVVPASALTRSKSYAAPGSYTITVTVTDRDGGVGTSSFTITVN